MAELSIEQITIPTRIDDPGAGDFIEMIELGNAIEADALGTDQDSFSPREQLPWWQSPQRPKHAVVARVDGRIVGRGLAELTDDPDSTAVTITVEVALENRRHGIGDALLEAAIALVPDTTTHQAWVAHGGAAEGDRLPAPTGFGSVPLEDPGTRFLLRHGFALEQVERISRLPLPVEVGVALAEASAAAGSDYVLHHWSGATPERWLDGVAAARSRMATDAPWAGVEPDSGHWDADRVRGADARETDDGRIKHTLVAEHLPSGELVAYNELSVPPELRRSISQFDTLVLADHRGHRLGMLVKAANLLRVHETHPGYSSVMTYNAEENRHMLSVNEALGFVAIGYEGAWRRDS